MPRKKRSKRSPFFFNSKRPLPPLVLNSNYTICNWTDKIYWLCSHSPPHPALLLLLLIKNLTHRKCRQVVFLDRSLQYSFSSRNKVSIWSIQAQRVPSCTTQVLSNEFSVVVPNWPSTLCVCSTCCRYMTCLLACLIRTTATTTGLLFGCLLSAN